MNWYVGLVLAWVFTAFLTSVIAILSTKSKWVRVLVVAVFVCNLWLTFKTPLEMLSRAKPAGWAWSERDTKEAEILGFTLKEGEAIYITLNINGEPRLYIYPWSKKMAENLISATAEAQAQGTTAMLGKPFQGGKPRSGAEGQQGEGQGEGEGGGLGERLQGLLEGLFGGNFSNSVEDRDPPMAYPKPQEAMPPKPRPQTGQIYERNEGENKQP